LKGPKVGKYTVNVQKFEEIAIPLLSLNTENTTNRLVFVVDEIGKMELTSQSFINSIRKIIESKVPFLATIAEKGGGFIDEVKRQGKLYTVTRNNRNELSEMIYKEFLNLIDSKQ
jgi:nucleoside-triphosphatase